MFVGGKEIPAHFQVTMNCDNPDITEFCMVDLELMARKCELFRSGFFQLWPMDLFIKIIRECLLNF